MIHILGLPADGTLPPGHAATLAEARWVAGAHATLEALGIPEERRLPLGRDMADLAAAIQQRANGGATVAVVAGGDPLLFGLGASLLPHLGRESVAVHPAPSSLQLLAARLGRPWHGWRIVSVHGRHDPAPLLAALTHAAETLVFTDPERGPAWLGRLLLDRGAGEAFLLHVGEALGQPGERVRTLPPAEAAAASFRQPNLVLAQRLGPGPAPAVDEAWIQGTVSKPATRALALQLLAPGPEAVFWDAGAGSGAVAMEAAARIPHGAVFALERDPGRLAAVRALRAQARAWMVETIPGHLADTAPSLPRPTHVFWGGGMSAANLEVLAGCLAPGGRLVASFVRLEVLEVLRQGSGRLGLAMTLHQLQHSVAQPLAGGTRLAPHNPVFLALLEKPA